MRMMSVIQHRARRKTQDPRPREDQWLKKKKAYLNFHLSSFQFIGSLFLFLWSLTVLFPSFALAQQSSSSTPADSLQAIITGPSDVAVGRTIVLDAGSSKTAGDKVTYEWFIGVSRQPVSRTVQAVYTPERPGAISFRLVVTAVIDGKTVAAEAMHPVTAFNRKIVLLADPSVSAEKITAHKQAATAAKVYLRVLQPEPSATPAGSEDVLVSLLAQNSDTLAGANALVVWTEGITGLQALLRAAQGSAELSAGIQNQTIVLITDQGVSTVARAARGPYAVLRRCRFL